MIGVLLVVIDEVKVESGCGDLLQVRIKRGVQVRWFASDSVHGPQFDLFSLSNGLG